MHGFSHGAASQMEAATMNWLVIHKYETHGERKIREVVLETESKDEAKEKFDKLKGLGYSVFLYYRVQ
jgi:hypothetical protein